MLLLSRLQRGKRGKEEKHLLGDTLTPPAAPLAYPLLKRLHRKRDGS